MSGKQAKKAAKSAATKKTAAKKSPKKAVVVKKSATPASGVDHRPASGLMNGPLVFMLAGTLALGIGIGMMVESRKAALDPANGDINAQMSPSLTITPS